VNKILFDANSTSPISAIIAVAPGDCVLINAWNLGIGETAQVFRLLVESGDVPVQQGGSCEPIGGVTASSVIKEEPYIPCNATVEVGQSPTQNITSIVISQPGYYNLHLTPIALGTAFIEAVSLTGDDACAQAAATCCCSPQQQWVGTSLSPCLAINPGGQLGHNPSFNIDPCCLLQQISNPVIPTVNDSIVVLQGGTCGLASMQDVIDLVMVCGTLGTFPLQPFAPLDSLVALDSGLNCKRLDAAALVTGLETPWAGISTTPALTITPGGVNGHSPTFAYDLCADLQAIPACACEPLPGDLVPIITGGGCVLATWPTIDVCDQVGLLPNGALIAGDTVLVREAGGACKVVLASTLQSGFDGGPINNPISAANGSCLAPSYSFQASPDSGMWYDIGLGAVVISDDNCTDFIQIGASIVAQSAGQVTIAAGGGASFLILDSAISLLTYNNGLTVSGAGALNVGGSGNSLFQGASVSVTASSGNLNLGSGGITLRLTIDAVGAWQLAGNPGLAGQVITSAGPGLPPAWAAASATVTFPLLAPTSATPQYSFVAQTGMGMAMDGAQLHFGSLDTVSPVWSVSSRLSIDTGATADMFLYGSRGDGSRGANVVVHGGNAVNPGIQVEGGSASLIGGDSSESNGGDSRVQAGSSSGIGTGGNAIVLAGNGFNTGGSVLVTAGTGSQPSPTGGHIRLRTNNGAAGTANPPEITMDHHGSVQYGDPYVFKSSSFGGSTSYWYGVAGDAVDTRGAHLRIWGGPGQPGGPGGDGGDVHARGGNATGAANDGGQLFLEGGAFTPGGVKGYVQLERATVAPVAAPNLTGGFAPIILFDDGANLHLYGWSVGAGAWQSVMLA
jgi:hypothetical protein